MEFSFDRFYRINRRAIIWIVLFALVYFLRSYFLLIFLTFIIGFFAIRISRFLMERLHMSRDISIAVVYVALLVGYAGTVWVMADNVYGEVQELQKKFPDIRDNVDTFIEEASDRWPVVATLIRSYTPPPDLDEPDPRPANEFDRPIILVMADDNSLTTMTLVTLAAALDPKLIGEADSDPKPIGDDDPEGEASSSASPEPAAGESFVDLQLERLTRWIRDDALGTATGRMGRFAVFSLLAILFSFMILLQYGRIAEEIKGLRTSKLRDFYEEAGEPVVKFALSVGRGFEAISVNAFITAILMIAVFFIFDIPQKFLLAIVVFVTSLIPIAGVVFEAVAIFLVTFNKYPTFDYHFIGVGVGIIVVHLFVQYVVAPIVFGRQFRLNAVWVLMILYVGQQVAGIWGLILGIPVANYFIRDVFAIPIIEEKRLSASAPGIEIKAEDKTLEPKDST